MRQPSSPGSEMASWPQALGSSPSCRAIWAGKPPTVSSSWAACAWCGAAPRTWWAWRRCGAPCSCRWAARRRAWRPCWPRGCSGPAPWACTWASWSWTWSWCPRTMGRRPPRARTTGDGRPRSDPGPETLKLPLAGSEWSRRGVVREAPRRRRRRDARFRGARD